MIMTRTKIVAPMMIRVIVFVDINISIIFLMTKNLKLLFIHHSTGGNLIKYGKVRDLVREKLQNIEFWDHGYNLYPIFPRLLAMFTFHTGLTDKNGQITGEDFDIVLSNNSPREYADIFSRDPTSFTLKQILNHDIVMLKNCFPTTKIESDEKLEEHKKYYTQVANSLKKYPDKLFIVFTSPPLRLEVTRPDWAKRARELANWMKSELIEGSKNLKVFDFFDLLADKIGENANMLRRDYCPWFSRDSHPNTKANREIAPKLAEFMKDISGNIR